MIKNITFLFGLMLSTVVFGQNHTVDWKSTQSKNADDEWVCFLEPKDTVKYLIRHNSNQRSYYIDILDTNLNLKTSSKIQLPCDELIEFAVVKNQLTAFCSMYMKDVDEDQLLAVGINKNGKLSATSLMLKEKRIEGKEFQFKLSISPNSERIAIIKEYPRVPANSREKVEFVEFNDKFKVVRRKDCEFLHNAKRKSVNVPIIADNGTFYMLQRVRLTTANDYFIYIYDPGHIGHKQITLRGLRISDITYKLLENDDLQLAGFTTNMRDGRFIGTFTRLYRGGLSHIYSKEYVLPEYTWEALRPKKEIKDKGRGLPNFKITNFIDDGDFTYLVGTHDATFTEEDKEHGLRKGIKSNGLVVVRFKKGGYFVWSATVALHQKDFDYNGYFNKAVPIMKDGSLYFFYNEIGHFDKKSDNEFGENVKHGTRIAKLEENGSVIYRVAKNIYYGLDNQINLIPFAPKAGENPAIILGDKHDKSAFNLGVLEVKM